MTSLKRTTSSNGAVPDVSNDLAKFASKAYRAAIKKGFLTKDENDGASEAPTSPTFYCLFSNLLYCFQSDDPNSYLGLIFLEGCTIKKVDKGTPIKFTIGITTVGGKHVSLVADSESSRQEWVDTVEQQKVVSQGRLMEDLESETLQLTHRVTELESDVKHVEGVNELLEMNIATLSESKEALVARVAELEAKLGKDADLYRAVDHERKLLLRARGILPRTIPSWAMHRAITSPTCAGSDKRAFSSSAGGDPSAEVGTDTPPGLDMAKVWVGTWNVGGMEPFVGLDLQRSYKLLRPFVPSGYDVYFVGIQEGVREGVFEVMEGLLASEGCRRIRLDSLSATNGNNGQNVDGDGDDGDEGSRASMAAGGDMSKILGKVDGSSGMFSTKYSGIALFVHQKYLPYLKVHTLNQFSAAPQQARGAVGVVCSILGRTILFLTCQLDSKDNERRRRQFVDITTTLGSSMGERGYNINEQFHHIIWSGAFNYSLLDISGNPLPSDIALKMLKDHLNITLYDTHDQLNQEKRSHHVFFGYREANPFPNFYPTYKKIENRPPLNYSEPNGDWLKQCYRIRHKEPFYKGGKTRETTPSYCDRVLYHSLADLATDLLPEPVAVDLTLLPTQGHNTTVVNNINTLAQRSTTKMIDNYQAVNDGEGMSISDHSPVFGTFLVRLFHDHAANMVLSEDQGHGPANQSEAVASTSTSASSLDGTPSLSRAGSGEGGSVRSKHGSTSKLIYVEGALKSNKGSRGNSLCDYGASNASGSAPVSPLKRAGSGSVLAPDMTNLALSAPRTGSREREGAGVTSSRNLLEEFEDSTPGRKKPSAADRAATAPSAPHLPLLTSPGGVHAFSGASLLPPGPYTIRISNFRVLWGSMDSPPAAVCVLFPLPYEVS